MDFGSKYGTCSAQRSECYQEPLVRQLQQAKNAHREVIHPSKLAQLRLT